MPFEAGDHLETAAEKAEANSASKEDIFRCEACICFGNDACCYSTPRRAGLNGERWMVAQEKRLDRK